MSNVPGRLLRVMPPLVFLLTAPNIAVSKPRDGNPAGGLPKAVSAPPDRENGVRFTGSPIRYECSFADRRHLDGVYFLRYGYSAGSLPRAIAPDVYEWRSAKGDTIRFIGIGHTAGGGWWIGAIGSEQVTGYNMNTGYHTFVYLDSQKEFECWRRGYRHGNY